MKESTWTECLESGNSINITPDKAKAKSLIETARGRLEYISGQAVNDKTANYIFEGYYSSLLELLHSIVLSRGFKVGNHICLGFYLRDILKREDLFRLFDDCRFKRNSLIYYGKKMDFETAKDSIERCTSLIEKLDDILKGLI